MPKATRKSTGEEGDDVPLHGAINKEEARQYSLNLDNIITKLGTDVKDEVQDVMKEAILNSNRKLPKWYWGWTQQTKMQYGELSRKRSAFLFAHPQNKKNGC